MNEEEKKAFLKILEKSSESRRANETPEQAMVNFEKYMKETTLGTSNTLKEILEKVKEELKHIPDWPQPQNELRMIYQTRRMNSLGKKAVTKQTAKEVLKKCISDMKKDHPDFQPKYDEDFFNKCD